MNYFNSSILSINLSNFDDKSENPRYNNNKRSKYFPPALVIKSSVICHIHEINEKNRPIAKNVMVDNNDDKSKFISFLVYQYKGLYSLWLRNYQTLRNWVMSCNKALQTSQLKVLYNHGLRNVLLQIQQKIEEKLEKILKTIFSYLTPALNNAFNNNCILLKSQYESR